MDGLDFLCFTLNPDSQQTLFGQLYHFQALNHLSRLYALTATSELVRLAWLVIMYNLPKDYCGLISYVEHCDILAL